MMVRARYILAMMAPLLLLAGGLVLFFVAHQRLAACAYFPVLAENLLPNADMSLPGESSVLPLGWEAKAPGVQVGAFAVDGDGRSLQLMGIANYVQTPPVVVQPGQSYCMTGMAITDSHQGSTSRVQLAFQWLDAQGHVITEESTTWQAAVLWQHDQPPEHWSRIRAAFRAPADAQTLRVRIYPSSDDRIYLDAFQVRRGGVAEERRRDAATEDEDIHSQVAVLPWPGGRRAALSFSFDWETAMGGLVHSRSVGDPFADQDPEQRGLRMREGITTTLDIFRPYGIRATYYATGYNFLWGNTQRMQFMRNPTYTWANMKNSWTSDLWQSTPWFAPDPYGTVQTHPSWYFGDLVPRLLQEKQDIQSHTFSHFYGGFVGVQDWRDDIATWNEVAATQGVPAIRSVAFPWSGSGGMSDANWQVLVDAGITSVTRLSDQSQYNLFPMDEQELVVAPHCRPLPGHAQILACPDFYLTPASAERAIEQIRYTLEQGGMIDLWSHTEEVVTSEQRAAWQQVVAYASAQPDLWIAPLREIATWQQALEQVEIQSFGSAVAGSKEAGESDAGIPFSIRNGSVYDLDGLTLQLPFPVGRVTVNGDDTQVADDTPTMPATWAMDRRATDPHMLMLNIRAGQTLELKVWPRT